ncbi:hypothetical protein BAE44_0009956 [Dichanthelium oligosanthes]|uniref:Uncharacterized protein n=1 Tax=Dichanthelium oligosanthes TaxID=888268 RepID=A0A1E5VV78_9POAL|nr:hypothetical protein BAE44_0009956 [Dichanthelium oligosanthes]
MLLAVDPEVHARSFSSATQSRIPCADTISSMDARKSLYRSPESTATATLPSASDFDGGHVCHVFVSSPSSSRSGGVTVFLSVSVFSDAGGAFLAGEGAATCRKAPPSSLDLAERRPRSRDGKKLSLSLARRSVPEAEKAREMGIKMDKTTIIVCSVVGSLGVLSAIFGFSAEGTKLTPYTILVYGDDCIYPQNPALGLGICAVIFLLVAQITISAVSGCCGCCKSRSIPSETKRIVGIVCAVGSWIAAVIAWALLIEGASWNANVVRTNAPFCPYLKDGIFAGGGVLTLAATALGITSFIMLRRQPAPVEVAATTPATSVGATPNRPGGQSPSSEVVKGHPLLPAAPSKAQHPAQPQAYVVQQVPPAASHPQGYEQAPQNLQTPPPPPAAAQDNGSHGRNQQFPPQGLPAAAAAATPAVAFAASGPGEQQQPAPALGVAMGQPQVSLPQVHVANGMPPQYQIPIPSPSAGAEMIPAPLPPTAPQQQGNGLSSVIRNELTRATIRFAEKAMEHAVFSNNTATSTTAGGDMLSMSMVTDPTGEPRARAGDLRHHLPSGGPDHRHGGRWLLWLLQKSRAIPSETKRIIGIVCAVVSWIAAVIAWALLIQGAAWNANVARVTAPDCFYLKDGIFAGGAVLTLAATALGLTASIMLRRKPANAAAAPAVQATGQPQFPPLAPAAAAPNKLSEQPPHAVAAMGQQQFWQQAAVQPPPATWVPTAHPHLQFSPPQAYAQPQPTSYH